MKIRKVVVLCTFFILMNSAVMVSIATPTDRDVIIGFKNPVGHSEKTLVQNHGLVKKSFNLIPAVAARMDDSNISEIKKDPRVKYVVDDQIVQAADINTDEYSYSWGARYIGSDLAAAEGKVGTGVKIAILDTGIDCSHIDLINNCYPGYNFYSNNSNSTDDNEQSHGTHVSGIAAAEKNGIGIVGVAPNVSVYAVKVLGRSGFSADSYVISGIEWAVEHNMNIISMSITGKYSIPVEEAVNEAYNQGLLLVAAAGNTPNGSVAHPAAYDNVIAVTAVDSSDGKAWFSPLGSKIELAAPGVNINSTVSDGYNYLSGTSQAVPYVSGVAALIMSTDYQDINGDGVKNNKDVRILLDDAARDVGIVGRDDVYGYGIVDASNATINIPNKISLIRTEQNSPLDDRRVLTLHSGNYTITIHSDTLNAIQMKDSNGVGVSTYNFSHNNNDINVNLSIENNAELTFIPLGSKGSSGSIKINANN